MTLYNETFIFYTIIIIISYYDKNYHIIIAVLNFLSYKTHIMIAK